MTALAWQTPAMARRWLLLLLALAMTVQPSPAQTLRAVVLSIGDADTIRLKQAGRPITVRLACIDAPEMGQSPWPEASSTRDGPWSSVTSSTAACALLHCP